jgi:hypothetical protein
MQAKVWFIGASLLVAAGTAFADDPNGGAGGDASGAGSGSGAPAAPTEGAPPAAMASDQLINTPLTLGKGAIGLTGGIDVARISVTIPPIPPATMPTTVSATAEILELGGGFGVTDKLQIGLLYALSLNDDSGAFPNSGKGPLTLYGGLSLLHQDKLDVAASADFEINVANTDDKVIHAGLGVRFMATPKVALFTGNIVPPGPSGQHLAISLASNGPITFSVPVGVAIQAAPKAYVWVDTTVADISISNSNNAFIFSDFIPIDVGLLYRVAPNVDLGAHFSDDLKNAGDFYIFGVLARMVMPGGK